MTDRYDTSGIIPFGKAMDGFRDLIALQAGQPLLDFSYMDEHKYGYFTAVQAGLDNYDPMKAMFRRVLHSS